MSLKNRSDIFGVLLEEVPQEFALAIGGSLTIINETMGVVSNAGATKALAIPVEENSSQRTCDLLDRMRGNSNAHTAEPPREKSLDLLSAQATSSPPESTSVADSNRVCAFMSMDEIFGTQSKSNQSTTAKGAKQGIDVNNASARRQQLAVTGRERRREENESEEEEKVKVFDEENL